MTPDFACILSADAQGEPSFHLAQCSSHQYTVLLCKNYLISIDSLCIARQI